MVTTELSKTDGKRLEDIVERIDLAKGGMVTGAIEIGKALAEAHEIVTVKNFEGGFRQWVEDRCGFSKSTAHRYMDAFAAFGKCPKLGHFDDSAMYLLARCKPAADKAKALANKGFRITHEKAKELVDEVHAAASKSAPERSNGTAAAVSGGRDQQGKSGSSIASNSNDSNEVDGRDQSDSIAFTCPTCGHNEADEDGDCAKCHEPAEQVSDPGPEPAKRKPKLSQPNVIGAAKAEFTALAQRLSIGLTPAYRLLLAEHLEELAAELRA